jgi:endoglucanase
MNVYWWWRIALVLILFGCTSTTQVTQGQVSQTPKLNRGGNLSGWFQFGTFQESQFAELQVMSDLGIDFIRLPIEPTRFYDRNSSDWALLDRVLTEAGRLNIKVIVDLHPSMYTQRLALTGDERYPKLLEDMARHLPKFGTDNVLLELMNEPISPTENTCDPSFDWNTWQRKFYDAARVGSKDITLVLTGACWGTVDGLLEVQPIQDARVIYSIHNYERLEFTHQGGSWVGPEIAYLRGVPYPATPERVEQALPRMLYDVPTPALKAKYRANLQAYGRSGFNRTAMEQSMARARDWARSNNTRILVGEYGVYDLTSLPQDRVVWTRDMREIAENMGMAHAIWDFSSIGTFGPYRNGKLEAGILEAMGLKVPSQALPTPPNPSVDSSFPTNPVSGATMPIADFSAGSQNITGLKTRYFAYGLPNQPTFTAAGANDTAPSTNGRLEFDYDIPLNNEYGGVTAVIPVKDGLPLDVTTAYTHLRLELADTSRRDVRVMLSSSKVDAGGDYPHVNMQVESTLKTFMISLSTLRQQGWGKRIDLKDVLKNLENIEITALTLGKPGRLIIDNIALVNVVDSTNVAVLPTDKQNLLYNFELPNNAGNAGGVWAHYGYNENSSGVVTTTASTVSANGGQIAQLNFDIPAQNAWAGAVLDLPFAATQSVFEQAALRLDASATGITVVRIELITTLDVGFDHPQFYLTLTPDMKTHRIPIGEFAQAGWGKAVDLSEALKNIKSINLNVDTVGAKGTLKVDNVIFEKK